MKLSEIHSVLRSYKLSPNQRFGQHFLHDENLARWIVSSAEISFHNRVLEIGPGLGSLTEFFLESGAEVIAIEIDKGFVNFLRERFSGKKIKIIHGDALTELRKNVEGTDIIAGNLPYKIAVPIILQSIIYAQNVNRSIWMIQREISERFVAKPKSPNYGAISVVFQIFCRIVKNRKVGTKVFFPEPTVQSNIIITEPSSTYSYLLTGIEKRIAFTNFVRSAFSQRRKMINKFLSNFPEWSTDVMKKVKITGLERPDEILPYRWVEIFEQLISVNPFFEENFKQKLGTYSSSLLLPSLGK